MQRLVQRLVQQLVLGAILLTAIVLDPSPSWARRRGPNSLNCLQQAVEPAFFDQVAVELQNELLQLGQEFPAIPAHSRDQVLQRLRRRIRETQQEAHQLRLELTQVEIELDATQLRIAKAQSQSPTPGSTQALKTKLRGLIERAEVHRGNLARIDAYKLELDVARSLRTELIDYERVVKVRPSRGGGDLLTEIDIETHKALIEVTRSSGREMDNPKIVQLIKHLEDLRVNPLQKPVIFYAPRYESTPQLVQVLGVRGHRVERDYFIVRDIPQLQRVHRRLIPYHQDRPYAPAQ